jgi:hypothetical protein
MLIGAIFLAVTISLCSTSRTGWTTPDGLFRKALQVFVALQPVI